MFVRIVLFVVAIDRRVDDDDDRDARGDGADEYVHFATYT